MLNKILESIGLENDNAYSGEVTEFQSDMIGMENFLDLQESLEATGMTIALESVQTVQIAMAMQAGEGREVEVLNAVGFESTEIGTEAVVDIAARKFYQAKAAIKSIIKVIINFVKKLLSLGNTTEKAFKAIKTKHKAYDKKWSNNAGKIKLDSDKEYSTKISDIQKLLHEQQNPSDGSLLGTFKVMTIILTIEEVSTIQQLKTALDSPALKSSFGKFKEKAGSSAIKDVKEKLKTEMNDIDTDDLKPTAYKTVTKSALDLVGVIAQAHIDGKMSTKLTKCIKNLNKVETNVGKLKEGDRDKIFGSDESFDSFLTSVSKLTEQFMITPVVYGLLLKHTINLSQQTFTEVDRILAY